MGIKERKLREKQERKLAILNQARELIAKKAFNDITMEDIASELELSRATLYLYFTNKNEIYITLLTNGFIELRNAYDQYLKNNPPKTAFERLRAMGRVFFEFYSSDHSYFDLMFTKRDEMLGDIKPETLAEHKTAGRTIIEPLMNAIKIGIENGEFHDRPPEKVAWLLRAIIIGIAMGFKEGKLSFPEDIILLEQLILPGLKKQS